MKLIRLIQVLYGKMIRLVTNGPWGRGVHRILIRGFCGLQRIPYSKEFEKHSTFLDFFLRDKKIEFSSSPLVSPCEARSFASGEDIILGKSVRVKGITYRFEDFRELPMDKFRNGAFWNFYLAPKNYHWVHAPTSGRNLRGIYRSGMFWPVNAFGRWLRPFLFSENERISYLYESATFGAVAVVCVGAMGVNAMKSTVGFVGPNETSLKAEIHKGDRLLAFELGSTVLLFLEHPPTSRLPLTMVNVGDALC